MSETDPLAAELAAVEAAAPGESLALARSLASRLLTARDGAPPGALNRLGMYFFHHHFDAEALPLYEAGLAAARSAAAPDASTQAMLLSNLGQVHERAGRFDAAVTSFEASLELKVEARDSPRSVAITRDNLAVAWTRMGQPARALPLHEAALEVFEQGADLYDIHVGTTLHNLASALELCGQRSRARACELRALDIQLALGGARNAEALIAAARVIDGALREQDLELAGPLGDWLLGVARGAEGALAQRVGTSLLALAEAAFDRAALALAERAATRARALLTSVPGMPVDGTMRAVSLLASIQQQKGNTFAAEREQFGVLQAGELGPHERAVALVEYAKTFRDRGSDGARQSAELTRMAIRALERPEPGVEGSAARTARPQALASAWGNLGQSLFRADRIDEADAAYQRAFDAIAGEADAVDRPWLASGHAAVHFNAGRDADALAGWTEARDTWARKRGPAHPWVAQCESNRALVLWQLGRADEAAAAFERAWSIDAPEQARRLLLGSDDDRGRVASAGTQAMHRIVSFHLATGAAGALAASALVQSKAATQRAQMQSLALLRDAPGAARKLDELGALEARIASRVAADQQGVGAGRGPQAVAALQDEAARLARELSDVAAAGRYGVRPPEWTEVQAALPEGTFLVEYLLLARCEPRVTVPVAHDYVALVLAHDGDPRWFRLGPAAEIDAAVEVLREVIEQGLLVAQPADPAPALHALAALVVAPLAAALTGARRLVAAADGRLHRVPFGLLWPLALGRPVEAVHVAGGAELLAAPPEAGSVAPPLAIVDPDFGDGPAGFAALPSTRREAEALAACWPDAQVLAGRAATAAALIAARRPWLLHLATHGQFLPQAAVQPRIEQRMLPTPEGLLLVEAASPSAHDDPMQHGGLAFAGANAITDHEAAGIVTARQLAQLDLAGTELVVLSACDTGLGRAEIGSEFAGLRRAFAIAGARSQLTALWPVEDDAGAAFMQVFYRALAAGRSRIAALDAAQASLRAQAAWAHPAYWAGFVLWGDGGPLPRRAIEADAA